MNLTRRQTLSMAAATAAAGVAGLTLPAFAKDGDMLDQLKLMAPMVVPDKIEGDPNAKVTLIEYLSPTCPHCALMANTVIGPFKDKYVKTGKVKFIPRPFARNTLDAAIFMLAEAATRAAAGTPSADASGASSSAPPAVKPQSYTGTPAEVWENVINTYFKSQNSWGLSPKPLDAVKAVALQLGFSEASFNTALQDTQLFNDIQTMQTQAVDDFGLEGTPTFYVNGKQLTGEKTLDELSKEVDALL